MSDIIITRGARRAVLWLLTLTLIIGGGNLWASWDLTRGAQHAAASSCKFFADLAGAPLAADPATGKAPLLAVSIVADSRAAWRGLGCPGILPSPSPSFTRWASYYHLAGG